MARLKKTATRRAGDEAGQAELSAGGDAAGAAALENSEADSYSFTLWPRNATTHPAGIQTCVLTETQTEYLCTTTLKGLHCPQPGLVEAKYTATRQHGATPPTQRREQPTTLCAVA